VAALALDYEWRFVVVIPDEELSTVGARRVLPERVPSPTRSVIWVRWDSCSPSGDHDAFVDGAMDDYLHQPYRMVYCPSPTAPHDPSREWRRGFVLVRCRLHHVGLATSDKAEGVAAAAKAFLHDQASPESCTCSKPTGPAW